MDKQIITREGWNKINEELDHLINVERPQIVKDIAVAREQGDLSENAEYSSAKEKQGIIEDRIRELKALLDNSEILDDSSVSSDTVGLGCYVKLYDCDMDEEVTYSIVSSAEADVDACKISVKSKLGEAMLGKKVGETFVVHAPSGNYEYKILELGKK